jgi:hypothetical protein
LKQPNGVVLPAEPVMNPVDLERRGAAIVNSPDARAIVEQIVLRERRDSARHAL